MVVACLNGDVLVKRLAQKQGQYILQSENPNYSPRYILENDELTIWGSRHLQPAEPPFRWLSLCTH